MHQTPEFRTEFKVITPELINVLPKVVLHSTGAIPATITRLSSENAVYVEHIVEASELSDAVVQAAEAPFTLALVVRCHSAEEINAAVADETGIVVGVIVDTPQLAAAARAQLIPYIYDGTLEEQVTYSAVRIIRPLALFDDVTINEEGEVAPGRLSSWVRDQRVPVFCDPLDDLAQGQIESLADHPLLLLRSMGFLATATELTTDLLNQLTEYLELDLNSIFALILEAIENSLLPLPLRQILIDDQIMPVFEELAEIDPTESEEDDHDHEHHHDHGNLEGLEDIDIDTLDPDLLEQFGLDPAELKQEQEELKKNKDEK